MAVQQAREVVTIIEVIMTGVFSLLFLYQVFYTFYVLLAKEKEKPFVRDRKHKFGVIVSARNEEAVIGQLLDSIGKQDYPPELVKVMVVADNCTDHTAAVCREKGAFVLERFNTTLVGKGYALDYLFAELREQGDDCDAYVVFDADNLVDKNFLREMNDGLNRGYKALTSYRNSKNYGTNWITAGYSLWFLREAKYLNNARMQLNTSCAISGTGFCIARELIEKNGGWPFHLLTEDMEFTVNAIVDGEKIGYCGRAVLYDEQPETFKQSWNQRLRWARGFYQVFRKYAGKLFGGVLRGNFACYDMLITILPGVLGFAVSLACSAVDFIYWILYPEGNGLIRILTNLLVVSVLFYILMFLMGFLTLLTEGDNIIGCSVKRKILSAFTFPLYMVTYLPIGLVALFKKVGWKPIPHTVAKTIEELDGKPAERGDVQKQTDKHE